MLQAVKKLLTTVSHDKKGFHFLPSKKEKKTQLDGLQILPAESQQPPAWEAQTKGETLHNG